jgi:SRSO17 transposase
VNLDKAHSWSKLFDEFFTPFGVYFQRSESRESAAHYLRGLLADVKRKNSWQLAEAVGLHDPMHYNACCMKSPGMRMPSVGRCVSWSLIAWGMSLE